MLVYYMDKYLDKKVARVIEESSSPFLMTNIMLEEETPYEVIKDKIWIETAYKLIKSYKGSERTKIVDHIKMQMEEIVLRQQLSIAQYYSGTFANVFIDDNINTYLKKPAKKNDTFYRKLERKGGRKKW